MTTWTALTERLPTVEDFGDFERVLVLFEGDVFLAYLDNERWRHDDGDLFNRPDKISHWAPVPRYGRKTLLSE